MQIQIEHGRRIGWDGLIQSAPVLELYTLNRLLLVLLGHSLAENYMRSYCYGIAATANHPKSLELQI
jgi:hypothetical protein